MLIDRSKEWWLKRIANECDGPIGAGVPDDGGYFMYVPTWRQRLRKWLGFRHASPPFDDSRTNEQVFFRLMVSVSFADRLRILLRGKVHISGIVFSDTVIPHADVQTNVGVPWSVEP